MGISQEVYTVYGWELTVTPEFNVWLEEVDYEYPKGIIYDGMSGEYVVIGSILFESGDARWEPLTGFSSFTLKHAEDRLNQQLYSWEYDHDKLWTKFQVMFPELKSAPEFHTFVHYS